MKEYFLIAEIKSVFNTDGFVTITSYSDVPSRFFDLEKVMIEIFGTQKEIFIEEVDLHGKEVILKFRNFDSDEDVIGLIGSKLFIDSKDSIELPADSFFIHDLIGSIVLKDDKFFGELIDVMTLSSNDVYVVRDLDANEVLIPAIKDYVEKFDKAEKKLYLTPGCDLDYAED